MFAPEIVYQYQSPKDLSGSTLEILIRKSENVDAAATPNATWDVYTVPLDKVLIITNLTVRMQGTFANTGMVRSLIKFTNQNTPRYETVQATGSFDPATGAQLIGRQQGEVWVPPGSIVQYFYLSPNPDTFSTACIMHGLVIPRANVGFA